MGVRDNRSEYNSYYSMKKRCLDFKGKDYIRYGGRGIIVCDRWLESFSNFLNDMGKRPSKEYTLERINNNGNYEPDNCRWATKKEQCNNTRRNKFLSYKGEELTVSMWADKIGIKPSTLYERLSRGDSVKKAIETPLKK